MRAGLAEAMSSEDDWPRRRRIARTWGGGFAVLGGVALFLGCWVELPTTRDPLTGHVFAVFNLVGAKSSGAPTFRYATETEFILLLATVGIAIASWIVAAIVYYLFDPNSLFRGASRELS